ncbi:MAG: hypothetical protein BWY82_01550 [Verrucomicrobia bacterium ADurb.Bin474]|nr:MAG: hypothetical protein BWY82_01550 [Verrucomicrobia bacterium ADurb.Bin474]
MNPEAIASFPVLHYKEDGYDCCTIHSGGRFCFGRDSDKRFSQC